MKSLAPVRQLFRSVASGLIALLIVQASPLPVLAATSGESYSQIARKVQARDLTAVIAELKADLARLQNEGKEAFLDHLFERLDRDQEKAIEFITVKIKQIGARKLCMAILAIGSPVLAAMLSVVPESWQEKLVVAACSKFIRKVLKEIKELVAKLPAATLERGLKATLTLCGNPALARSAIRGEGQSWWEKFFGNSTVVRNFVICIVALSAIGVAVGLAIAGATTAPVVAVVGALVALIALIAPGGNGHNLQPEMVD